eukprot:6614782-Alexandrium_andersonii.AAC.1
MEAIRNLTAQVGALTAQSQQQAAQNQTLQASLTEFRQLHAAQVQAQQPTAAATPATANGAAGPSPSSWTGQVLDTK